MNEKVYHAEIDKLFLELEETLETASPEIETFQEEGILKVTLAEGSQLIFSRQTPLQELWLASPIGAFHFHLKQDEWVTHQGQSLKEVLMGIFKHFEITVQL